MNHDKIQEAIARIRDGRMIILVDDEDRENEGDLVIAAEKTTPEAINFMAKYGRGLICLSLTEDRCDELDLFPMVQNNTAKLQTAFTVSVEAREGVSTGISAHDRAHTILVAVNPHSKPSDLVKPGHVFPLRARKGGVLARTGQTEGSVDLARLAGLYPAGVICEIMSDDGTMARLPELQKFSREHDIPIVSIADLVSFRLETESLVTEKVSARLPTEFGSEFNIRVFESSLDQYHHVAIVKGNIDPNKTTMVRVHSECFTGDVLSSLRCDCKNQLNQALQMISKEDQGVVLYLRQEGRGIGLINKLKAYNLQDQGLDTVEANEKLGFPMDLREYGVGAQILKLLGIQKMKLLTNNPKKMVALEGYGLEIVEQIPLIVPVHQENRRYLETKVTKMGHQLKVK